MSKEQRQSSKLWEPRSFDACKNAAAPMIAMLGRPELDTEVSDAGMETAKSNNCRRVSNARRSEIFLQRWTEVYQPIYPVNQWIVSDKPVVSKDQRAGRIKWSDIEVQIHTITGRKYYGQVGNFGDGAV